MSYTNPDPYDTSKPKYQTALEIYDALESLANGEEIGILSEMFADVSWDGQDYYYQDKGGALLEKFNALTDCGDKMWLMDLAVSQIDECEIHGLVFDALHNADLAKRIGFRKLFVEHLLCGDARRYNEIAEAFAEELGELDRFGRYENMRAFCDVMEAHGQQPAYWAYDRFSSALAEKVRGLRLDEETRLVAECRALLTAYDDFIYGLRMNQALFDEQRQRYQAKVQALQASYNKTVEALLLAAQQQGLQLELGAWAGLPHETHEAHEAEGDCSNI